ncbi:MAG: hypothetical protein GEU93_18670 [Propionibacteriales bacterium]|nr:hypothetical protein [Propionibacteriales bacterium]
MRGGAHNWAERRSGLDRRRSADSSSERLQLFRHDVRQPLGALFVLLAVVETEAALSPEVRQRLRQMQKQTELIADLLDTLAPEAPQVERIALGAFVEDVWAAMRPTTRCRLEVESLAEIEVLAEPVGLRRSVRNLLENAVRAAGDDGSVLLRVRALNGDAVFEVEDSGPGFGELAPQQGLGLVTVRRFAERSGGALTMGTASLGGARVSLWLPLAVPALATVQRDSA